MIEGTDGWTVLTILLLTANTVITRCFFFLSSKNWTMPGWLQRSMAYAPIAALSAVIGPEVLMTQGQLIGTWQDARLVAGAAGGLWYDLRRGLLGTLVCGMAVYLPLRLLAGW
jgi:branched-subunit amino acid transport protein